MTVAVCLRFVPDPEAVRVDPATGGPDTRRAPWRTNPLDEHALAAAVAVRPGHGGRVVAVSAVAVRPPEHVVRRVLACGADEVHLACGPDVARWQAGDVAASLAGLVRGLGDVTLVVAGAMSADASRGEVGYRLAEALGAWPAVGDVRGLEVAGGVLRAERSDGPVVEVVEVRLPAVAVVGGDAAPLRLPSIRAIAAASGRPVVEHPAVTPPAGPGLDLVSLQAPPSGRRRQVVGGGGVRDRVDALLAGLLADGSVSR